MNMKKVQSGFTLIELMIVVAIIAILAAIAIPAYNNYIREARMSKVVSHYDEAVRSTKAELAKRMATLARGGTPAVIGDAATLISDVINPENATAPGGGNAYVVGAGDVTSGAVGVTLNGADPTITVIIDRPAYLDVVAASTTIDQSQI